MNTLVDFLIDLGVQSVPVFWIPLLIWTTLAALVVGLLHAARSLHPRFHHHARLALLLSLPLGFLGLGLFKRIAPLLEGSGAQELLVTWNIGYELFVDASAASVGAANDGIPWFHLLAGFILAASLVLAAVQLVRLLALRRGLSRFRRKACAGQHEALTAITGLLARDMGIRRTVTCVVHEREAVPMTFGWLRPTIVLPPSVVADERQLRMVLMHELAHVRAHDYLFHWISHVTRAVFFIHPLVHYLCREIEVYRELSCDAEVLARANVRSAEYATLLCRLLPTDLYAGTLPVNLSTSSHLKRRIKAMKSYTRNTWLHLHIRSISIAAAGLLLLMGTLLVACSDMGSLTGGMDRQPEENRYPDHLEEVFVVVEEMPKLIGGLESIQQHIRYPEEAKNEGIEGRVIVQFVVDEEGNVIQPQIVRGIDGRLDQIALEAVQQAEFEPGRQRGQPVKVRFSIPITFRLGPADQSGMPPPPVDPDRVPQMAEDGEHFIVVEEMPQLIGGLASIQQQIRYPETARRAGVEGRVIVQFIVDETGRVTNPQVVRGIGAGCDEEALRVVQLATFTPGRQGGQPVKVRFAVPVTFSLRGDGSSTPPPTGPTGEPETPPPPPVDPENLQLRLSIESDRSIRLNETRVTLDVLENRIRSITRGQPFNLLVDVAPDTPAEAIRDVQNLLRTVLTARIMYRTQSPNPAFFDGLNQAE